MKPKVKAYLVASAMFVAVFLGCWVASLITGYFDEHLMAGAFAFVVAVDYLTEKYKRD